MGSFYAAGLRDSLDSGLADLETVVSIHLSSNMFPPIPQAYVAPAVLAIQAASVYDGDEDIDVTDAYAASGGIPRDHQEVDGRFFVEAYSLVRALRLEAFVTSDPYDFEDGE